MISQSINRKQFLHLSTFAGMANILGVHTIEPAAMSAKSPWFDRPMRWAQLTLVENDPGNYDPSFWLDYFKRTHSDAACLSAGGIVAYYPTQIPLHHRSAWMGDTDPFGQLLQGCRDLNMVVIARTDPHAIWPDAREAHPEWIAVDAKGNKRRHWSNPDLSVTCALGPYNFEFMTEVHKEIMSMYQIEGIFSNRWKGHGICYCEHCKEYFNEYCGNKIPLSSDRRDPIYQKYIQWRNERLKELWLLWDQEIRKINPNARYIPNGYPDKIIVGELSDILFTDHQARRGMTIPWSNGKRGKEFRATMGNKPIGGIFSVGLEEPYRWKDSVQSEAEVRIWVAEGTANGMRPWFTKFSGQLYDKRWLRFVEDIYQWHYRAEKYLRNVAPLARVGMVYSEQTEKYYGSEPSQKNYSHHGLGMYHALIEARIPFEMVNDRLLEPKHIDRYKLLILPNIAALSEHQCKLLRQYVKRGGSLLATYQTSLYDEEARPRNNFGLSDLFGVTYKNSIEGPMKNSYLSINKNLQTGNYHPIVAGLEDATRIINGTWRLNVAQNEKFPSPITLIPSYPDLPMEHVYPRVPKTDIREAYLCEIGNSRIVYFPWDIDRIFWEVLNVDHGKLLRNAVEWAANEEQPVTVSGQGVLDVTVWKQKTSMTVHLVNLTNPMMMKGPFRELIPISAQKVKVRLPKGKRAKDVKLLVNGSTPTFQKTEGSIILTVPSILAHEVIAIDL